MESNALAGPDEILVAPGTYTLALPGPAEDAATTGDLDITDDLTVSGSVGTPPVVSAASLDRAFHILGAVAVALEGLEIRDGDAGGGSGGGILADSSGSVLSLVDAVVSSNAAGVGGGVSALGTLTLTRTTINGNTATVSGGGVGAVAGNIAASTFFGNTAPSGSIEATDLLATGDGALTIENSTFHGILASLSFCLPPPEVSCSDGPTILIRNSTIGDLRRYDLGLAHGPTLVANSVLETCTGTVASEGHNLVADSAGCVLTGDTTGNLLDIAPALNALGYYGGSTRTRPPLPGSPLIDAGDPAVPGSGGTACEAFDQRGDARPFGARCDIGAVETRCGDGTAQTEEECDDGNAVNGDGCDQNCTFTACGNGIVTGSEECDDGNVEGGDCCDAGCMLAAVGSSCADDGNQCTAETCNAAGVCIGSPLPAGSACDDGNLCTSADACDGAGNCTATFCDPCLECNVFTGCVFPASCTELHAVKAKIKLRTPGPAQANQLRVSWKGGTYAKSELPQVGSGTLRVCVYEPDDTVVASGGAFDACASSGDCWSETNTGFRYKDKDRLPDGLSKIKMSAGNTSRMTLAAKGANFTPSALPLLSPLRFRAFRGLSNECIAAEFSDVQKSTATLFKAKGP